MSNIRHFTWILFKEQKKNNIRHVTVIDKEKAVESMGKKDFAWFMKYCPGNICDRMFFGKQILQIYQEAENESLLFTWLEPDNWFCFESAGSMGISKPELRTKARQLIDLILSAKIDTWEIWS